MWVHIWLWVLFSWLSHCFCRWPVKTVLDSKELITSSNAVWSKFELSTNWSWTDWTTAWKTLFQKISSKNLELWFSWFSVSSEIAAMLSWTKHQASFLLHLPCGYRGIIICANFYYFAAWQRDGFNMDQPEFKLGDKKKLNYYVIVMFPKRLCFIKDFGIRVKLVPVTE